MEEEEVVGVGVEWWVQGGVESSVRSVFERGADVDHWGRDGGFTKSHAQKLDVAAQMAQNRSSEQKSD